MEKIRFCSGCAPVSRIGLGLAALGRPGYINLGHREDLRGTYEVHSMEQQTHRMLDLALQNGINYFDVAQSYGNGESFLSSWLRKHDPRVDPRVDPREVVVGSKWGYYYTAGWRVQAEHHEIKDHTLERLNKQWPESESKLAPWLKLYQIHSATFESGILENMDVLHRLADLKEEGYMVGLSLSGPQQAEVLQAALQIRIEGEPLFGAVQATYNLLEPSVGDALRAAKDQGLTTIVKEGVANGRLTSRNPDAPYYVTLSGLAAHYQLGTDTIALAYILHRPFVDVVLSGAALEEHLMSNLRALDVELTADEMKRLEGLKMAPARYWKERGHMPWN